MKKILTALSGVVIVCALSGCVSDSLKTQQEKERTALSQKQRADRQVERAKDELAISSALTADATHHLKQARQKQADADAILQDILFPQKDLVF